MYLKISILAHDTQRPFSVIYTDRGSIFSEYACLECKFHIFIFICHFVLSCPLVLKTKHCIKRTLALLNVGRTLLPGRIDWTKPANLSKTYFLTWSRLPANFSNECWKEGMVYKLLYLLLPARLLSVARSHRCSGDFPIGLRSNVLIFLVPPES